MAFSFNQSTNFTLHCISVVIFISKATTLDKTVETLLPVLYFLGHNLPSRAMYKLSPSPPSFYVVLVMMLAHTNPVMSKTTLEEGRGREDTFAVARKFFLKVFFFNIMPKCYRFFSLSQVVLGEIAEYPAHLLQLISNIPPVPQSPNNLVIK